LRHLEKRLGLERSQSLENLARSRLGLVSNKLSNVSVSKENVSFTSLILHPKLNEDYKMMMSKSDPSRGLSCAATFTNTDIAYFLFDTVELGKRISCISPLTCYGIYFCIF